MAAYLPEIREVAPPEARIERVTLRGMLAHASGLASEPPGTDWTVPRYEGLAERILGQPGAVVTRIPPGQHPKYSNLAYQLLGEVIARASGLGYPDYVREEILLPLGMNSTAFSAAGDWLHRQAIGYAPRAFTDELDVASPAPQMGAEGGLWSCVDDLLKWVSAQLAAYRTGPPGSAILAAASLREMHSPRYLDGDDWTKAWGLSWCAVRRARRGVDPAFGGAAGVLHGGLLQPRQPGGRGGPDQRDGGRRGTGHGPGHDHPPVGPGQAAPDRPAGTDPGDVPPAPRPVLAGGSQPGDPPGVAGRHADLHRPGGTEVAADAAAHREPLPVHRGGRRTGSRASRWCSTSCRTAGSIRYSWPTGRGTAWST